MKIVFVIGSITLGGAERVASLLCNEWGKNNEVTILLTSVEQRIDYILENVKIEYLSKKIKISGLKKISIMTTFLKKNKPDVVVSFTDPASFYASIACKRAKIKHISSERNAPQYQPQGFLLRRLRDISYFLSDAIVFQTKDALNYFSKTISRKGVTIKNPLFIEKEMSRPSIQKLDDLVIAAGRLVEQKDYFSMIDSFVIFHKKFSNFQLHIYGEGPLQKEIFEFIKKRNSDGFIFLKGYTREIHEIIANSKIFFMTSKHEGMPNSLIEALSFGVPASCTNCPVGGPYDLLKDDHGGILTKVGDVQSMADSLTKIANEYEKYYNDSIAYSFLLKQELNIKNISKEWLELFSNIK